MNDRITERATQAGSQVPLDFSIGFGTEAEARSVNLSVLVVLALALTVVVYLVQRKGKKR